MSKIFQSDCDVINHRLKSTHSFDVIENVYTFYLPNLLKNIKLFILIINSIAKYINQKNPIKNKTSHHKKKEKEV